MLFRSSIAGGLLFVTASAIIFLGEKFSSEAIIFINSWLLSSDAAVLALSALIALVAPPIWNSLYNDDKATRRVAERNSDVIELLITESLEKSLPVEFSLSNSKCYIGLVVESHFSRQRDSDLVLVPIASGYRDKNNCELVLTTNYTNILLEFMKNYPEQYEYDDFRIVIRMSELTSARFFHPEVYERFQSDK